jgi:hypothetical protein
MKQIIIIALLIPDRTFFRTAGKRTPELIGRIVDHPLAVMGYTAKHKQ